MNEQETCLWFESNLNAYLDGELDREARGRMDEHARSCPDCGQKLETMTRLLTMCAELDEGLAVPLSAQAAWREAIRAEAQSRGRTRRVGAWTRSMGWIAAALTLLTVSTALFGQDVIAPPAQVDGLMAKAPAGAAYSAPAEYGAPLEDRAADAGTLSITADGAIEGSEGTAGQQTVVDSASEREQVVLRSASYAIATAAFDTDSQNIDNLVDEYDAYYESDSQSGQPIGAGRSDGRQRTMLIRVPAAQLDEFLTSLDVIGSVTSKTRSAEDVSANYYDAAAQLDALEAQQAQIERLMGSAADIGAVVELQDKFYELQAEINSLESRIRGWESKADYVRVNVDLTEVTAVDPERPTGDTLMERVRTGFFDSVDWLGGFLQDMAVMLAALAPVLVVLIPLIVLIVVIVRVVRAKRRR